MAKIKKLKENGSTIYPATIPEAVVDPNNKTKLSEIIDDLALTFGDMGESKNIIQAMSDLRSTIGEHSESGLDGYAQYLNLFIDKVNSFLEDADASDTTINRWKEIESFLTGITDTKTLTGLLNDTLTSAKSYADGKVSSGTANMVTMSANAAASDRVLTSAGTNKTAKDSGVAISFLMKTDLSNANSSTLENKLRGIGFQKTYPLVADYNDSPNISFMPNTSTTVRSALQAMSDGEGTVILVPRAAEGSGALVLSSFAFTSTKFCVWFMGTDDNLYYFEVETSGSSPVVSNVRCYNFDAFLKSIPIATSAILGGVRVGSGLTATEAGVLSVTSAPKATNDSAGNNIAATYLKAAAVTDVTDYPEITI